jgi:hypothetical protein
MRRFVAIGLVWLGSCLAWMILGSTLLARSGEISRSLGDEVHELWGPPIAQRPPEATIETPAAPLEAVVPVAAPAASPPVRAGTPPAPEAPAAPEPESVPLVATEIRAKLDLEHRKKGLIWFPTYGVDFDARYTFENPDSERKTVALRFPLESAHALYDGFEVLDGEGRAVGASVERGVAHWKTELGPRERATYRVKYRSRGTTRWQYQLTAGTGQVKDFRLVLDADFDEIDFASGTLSPTTHSASGGNWHGEWTFKTLVASSPIGIDLPERLNPGPLAARITFFAPVALLFFFFVVAILAHAQKRELHPMHYFFLGCAFFAFHLLFAYLVDHVAIAPSFALASLVSVGLVVSYARLFVGWRFALVEMGVAQLFYLVLFSFTFFWTGFTGLSITVGAILTLFVMMQITGRSRWVTSPPESARACAAPYRCGLDPGEAKP